MAEILNLDQMLEALEGFGPLRRILLATSGTLQSTLSAYFRAPITVEVQHQEEFPGQVGFQREVTLWCRERNLIVCQASSKIDVENEEIWKLIHEQKMGLGQAIETLNLPTHFEFERAGSEAESFWRDYTLKGPGFCYRIHEVFPNALYPDSEG